MKLWLTVHIIQELLHSNSVASSARAIAKVVRAASESVEWNELSRLSLWKGILM